MRSCSFVPIYARYSWRVDRCSVGFSSSLEKSNSSCFLSGSFLVLLRLLMVIGSDSWVSRPSSVLIGNQESKSGFPPFLFADRWCFEGGARCCCPYSLVLVLLVWILQVPMISRAKFLGRLECMMTTVRCSPCVVFDDLLCRQS